MIRERTKAVDYIAQKLWKRLGKKPKRVTYSDIVLLADEALKAVPEIDNGKHKQGESYVIDHEAA